MGKIRVAVVDNESSFVSMLKEYFQTSKYVEICYEASDGLEGFKMIQKNQDDIDLILLDLIMPHCDGITLLEKLREEKITKKTIVLTGYQSSDMVTEVLEFGVNYFMLKPFSLSDLERRILKIFEVKEHKVLDLQSQTLQMRITDMLHNLGMPSNVKGYHYIRESILLIVEKPDLLGSVTKELYPEIAERFHSTASRVERSMRHAIEISFTRGNLEVIEDIFRFSMDSEKAKPTNSEFISMIAERIQSDLEQESFQF